MAVIHLALVILISGCGKSRSLEDGAQVIDIEQSSLPPLHMDKSPDLLTRIETIHEQNGLDAVIDWVEKELVPGRKIVTNRMGHDEEYILYDRSIWKLDSENKPTDQAILPPLKDEDLKNSDIFSVTSFPNLAVPFQIQIRSYYKENTDNQ